MDQRKHLCPFMLFFGGVKPYLLASCWNGRDTVFFPSEPQATVGVGLKIAFKTLLASIRKKETQSRYASQFKYVFN